MGEITFNFEKEFAKYVGSKYALMTTQDHQQIFYHHLLLLIQKNCLYQGMNFNSSLCWSTSLWPLVQA